MSQRYTTTPASERLKQLGRRTSRSLLQKLRTRGPADSRDKGPDFERDPATGVCWYTEEALAKYAAERVSTLRLRAPAPMPANFRRAG